MTKKRTKTEHLPPLPGKPNPCLSCPPIVPKLSMRRRIAVGFGTASVERDGETVWEESGHEYADCWTVQRAENRAAKQPLHDWRIILHGPMHGETYQRQGKGLWVLVERNQGFA